VNRSTLLISTGSSGQENAHSSKADKDAEHAHCLSSRPHFLGRAGAATLALLPPRSLADTMIKLPLPRGPDERPITTGFPEKGALILRRTRPPLLETPFEVFDQSVFTPNDRFFVRWHWALNRHLSCRHQGREIKARNDLRQS
jgi:hypothetical protein